MRRAEKLLPPPTPGRNTRRHDDGLTHRSPKGGNAKLSGAGTSSLAASLLLLRRVRWLAFEKQQVLEESHGSAYSTWQPRAARWQPALPTMDRLYRPICVAPRSLRKRTNASPSAAQAAGLGLPVDLTIPL